jgi:hypothetical protein
MPDLSIARFCFLCTIGNPMSHVISAYDYCTNLQIQCNAILLKYCVLPQPLTPSPDTFSLSPHSEGT